MRNRLALSLILIILTSAVAGGLFGEETASTATLEDDSKEFLRTFSQVFAKVQEHYGEDVSSEELVETAIRGMLRTLDPHSSFFSVRDYDRLQEEQKGKYQGLGITIRAESPGSGRVVIVEPPAPGTPAYKAGLRAGDVIAEIEGIPIDDWDLNEDVIPNLKGPQGTKVNITVERPGEDQPLPFTVERDEIPLYTIKYAFRIRPDIGYVRISRFAETTSRELDEALESIDEATLEGLILDLRDNPGGALSQALAVSDRFLNKGDKIVSTRSRSGQDNRDYHAKEDRQYEYSMVVLINQNSASASEIVSGALQDHDRALILGETSFGKALVQTIFPLEGKRGLALTTGKYYTPSDRLIQRDYSESFWEYYNNREQVTSDAEDGEEFYTDGGRVVYGGGGINPDEVVELDKIPIPVRKLRRDSLFRDYASRVYSGEIESDLLEGLPRKREAATAEEIDRMIEDLRVDEKDVDAFLRYAASREKDLDLAPAEEESPKKVIANFLKQELLMLMVGDEASYRVALELDRQVQKAIDRLPQVTALLQAAVEESAKQ